MLQFHPNVVFAVLKRNVASYFSGVLGYLFIVVFVVVGGYFAFQQQFFTNNEANLDQLTGMYPLLLLFLIPAITMTAWSDEKKLGTDELLFTLPASDLEILVGKYLAVLTVYTIALLFSSTHAIVLAYIGDPETGVIFATYLGYWLAGAALLAAGMFASVLTSSATVAFVLGAVICSIPVYFIEQIAGPETVAGRLSVATQLRDFSIGLVPLSGVVYFISLALFMLYLNMVFISRRHWSGGKMAGMGAHFAVRTIALAIILISLTAISTYASVRADLTSEKLYTLSETTHKTVDRLANPQAAKTDDADRENEANGNDQSKEDKKGKSKNEPYVVTIQAFISKDVPQQYVDVRRRLLGLLRRYDREGGKLIDVRYVDIEPFSKEEEEAIKHGITARTARSERNGRLVSDEVYMGAKVESRAGDIVIDFFGNADLIEYELTRAIGTVSKSERRTIGILRTDAGVIRGEEEWQIVTELRRQYDITEVSADSKIEPVRKDEHGKEERVFDVLIAVMPSSLTQPQFKNLVDYVKAGHPALICDDPFPGMLPPPLYPSQEKSPQRDFRGQPSPSEPKADDGTLSSLTRLLKIEWKNDQVIWDQYNPHIEYEDVWPQTFVFVGKGNGLESALNPNSPVTQGFNEVLCLFPGSIKKFESKKDEKNVPTFVPLLRSGRQTGILEWEEFTREVPDVQMTMFGPQVRTRFEVAPNPDYLTPLQKEEEKLAELQEQLEDAEDDAEKKSLRKEIAKVEKKIGQLKKTPEIGHTIAAHITQEDKDGNATLNVIFVSDVDFLGDQFFDIRNEPDAFIDLDNVPFLLNAIDVLAEDDAYLDLRRRSQHDNRLTLVEKTRKEFDKKRQERRQQAVRDARKRRREAQKQFEEAREEIANDKSLDNRQKLMKLANVAQDESIKLKANEESIEKRKQKEVEQYKAEFQREVREAERGIMFWAIIIPPIPAILLGLIMLGVRVTSERSHLDPSRMRS